MKYTGILILNYNNFDDTVACFNSIKKYNSAPVKILIVDNGSSNREVPKKIDKLLNRKYGDDYKSYKENDTKDPCLTKYTSLFLNKNYGYAVGNNKGLKLFYKDQEIDSVLIINNDVLFIEDMLPGILQQLNKHPYSIISPLLYKTGLKEIDKDCCRKQYTLKDIFIQHMFLCRNIFGIQEYLKNKNCLVNEDNIKYKRLVQVDMPSGSCMLFKKNVFYSLGGFDPNTFLYYEENILCVKMKKLNNKVFVDFSKRCIHLGASTVKKTSNSIFSTRCWINSCKYYLINYTHAPSWYLRMIHFFFNMMIIKAQIATFLRNKHLYL
jgi:GT2 family glycosyltransferase